MTESEFDSIDRTGGPGSGTDGPSSFREWLIAFGALTMLAGILVLSWPGLTVLAMTVIVGLQMLTNAGIAPDVTAAALEVNGRARIDGLRSALAVLALIAAVGVFFARRIPARPPQSAPS